MSNTQDYNKTSGISEVVQQQMDQGVDPAAASAMEYANYLSGQRTEGYGASAIHLNALLPDTPSFVITASQLLVPAARLTCLRVHVCKRA